MNTRSESKKKRFGMLAAGGVVLTQGLEAVLLPLLFYAGFMFMISRDNGIAYSAGVMSIKELISLILVIAYLGPKVIIKAIKLMAKKKSIFFILSGLFGTAMGNLLFIVGIVLAGPSYGVILTAFYPIWAIGLNKIVYREKDNWISKVGMFLSIISGALFVVLPVLIGGGKIDNRVIAGMCCGLLAGFFWALEGLLLRRAMDKNPDVQQKEVIAMRTITVAVTSWLIFVPISIGVNFGIEGHMFNTYSGLYGELFTNNQAWIVWLIMIVAGVNILILRILHTKAIEMIGQKLTAIIDTNNFIVPALFALMLQFIPGVPGQEFKDSLLEPYLWSLLIPLSIGLILVLIYHGRQDVRSLKQMLSKKKDDEEQK